MSSESVEKFDLKAHLDKHYEVAQVDGDAEDDIVLNPADDRLPFSGSGVSIERLHYRKDASGIPAEFYPLVLRATFKPMRGDYERVVRAMKGGRAKYDEGTFNRPAGAVLDSRYSLAFLMMSHGVSSMMTRFFDDGSFVERTAEELMEAVELHGLYLATFTQNFMQIGVPFYRAAGVRRCDDGFSGLMKEGTRKAYRRMATGAEWVSYYRYLDVLFAFANATEAERKDLYASILASESVEDVSVTLGGRIRDNFYTGTGRYPPMSLRYAGELALLLVKHGIARPDYVNATLELTDAGVKVIELLPERCDDADRYGHFLDFSTYPPSIPAREAAAVEAWLMDYFAELKAAGEALAG